MGLLDIIVQLVVIEKRPLVECLTSINKRIKKMSVHRGLFHPRGGGTFASTVVTFI